MSMKTDDVKAWSGSDAAGIMINEITLKRKDEVDDLIDNLAQSEDPYNLE